MSTAYNLIPHNEILVAPFIIKTAETPIEITVQIISKNKIIFNEAKQIEMQKTETQSQEEILIELLASNDFTHE